MPAIPYIAVAVAAYSAYDSHEQQAEARSDARKARGEQEKSIQEQKAMNEQKAAEERRQQIREDRVRRAKIMQASENTGTAGSSGEVGAMNSLTTQLNTNIGSNQGSLMHMENINGYNQMAADWNQKSQEALYKAQESNALFGASMSIFNATGGQTIFKDLAKGTTNVTKPSIP